MKECVTYEEAVEFFGFYMDELKIDAFTTSSMLCGLFGTADKEKTLQDVINVRERCKVR